MQWKITDVAGPSQLGSKERLQCKKNLLGELEGHTVCLYVHNCSVVIILSQLELIYSTLEYNADHIPNFNSL